MNDDERDPIEERYWRDFCPACGTSPCESDGNDEDHNWFADAMTKVIRSWT